MSGSNLVVLPGRLATRSPLWEEKIEYQEKLVNEYLSVLSVHYAERSRPNHSVALRSNFMPWLEDQGLFLWEVKSSDFDRFSEHLIFNQAKSTASKNVSLLSTTYDWLISRKSDDIRRKFGVLVTNPVDKWNTPPRKNEDDELPEIPDQDALDFYFQVQKAEFDKAVAIGNHRKAALLGRQITAEKIAHKAGLRVEEVSNLNVGDIDLDSMLIFVREGKGGKDRPVDITEYLGPVLKWYLQQLHPEASSRNFPPSNSPLFISEQKQRISLKTLQHRLWQQQDIFGVPIDKRFSFHGLRRGFATDTYQLLRSIGHSDPLMYVKTQLGHAFLNTTLKYVRIPEAVLAQQRTAAIKKGKKLLLGVE